MKTLEQKKRLLRYQMVMFIDSVIYNDCYGNFNERIVRDFFESEGYDHFEVLLDGTCPMTGENYLTVVEEVIADFKHLILDE